MGEPLIETFRCTGLYQPPPRPLPSIRGGVGVSRYQLRFPLLPGLGEGEGCYGVQGAPGNFVRFSSRRNALRGETPG